MNNRIIFLKLRKKAMQLRKSNCKEKNSLNFEYHSNMFPNGFTNNRLILINPSK